MLLLFVYCLISYCIGSLSSAVIVCRLAGLPDPRTVGSHNPGATNVLRVGGKKAAFFTLFGDVIKGVSVVLALKYLAVEPQVISAAMVAVVLGHLYPVFFKFQGGKGVATAVGAILAFSWPVGLALVATWLLVVIIFRISSLGALTAALFAPFYTFWLAPNGHFFVFPIALISALLFFRHRANIKRLVLGTEPKLGKGKRSQ